ncbi:MAG TPA: cytochrome c biogenesis protein CcsA [Burkholderiales bacterium]|nr:cytochrome c biogenesis protein CcsA [Burkholderiales bacterium]
MPDIVVHLVATAAYLGLAWHFWNTRWRPAAALEGKSLDLRAWERIGILLPATLHGWLIYQGIFAAPELRFGFAQALSAMLWLAVLIYWVESLYFRLEGMQPLVLAAAGACLLLPLWFPGRVIAQGSTDFKVHLTLALIAYSLFTIAILHAVLMAVADRLLHRGLKNADGGRRLEGPLANLPPLLTIERMLFRLITVAFVFLTVTLATGMVLSNDLFGKPLRFNHETVFAVASWLTFAILLWGRVFRGWRGQTALRWTIAGFVMVVLANIGTAFVLEVVLKRV